MRRVLEMTGKSGSEGRGGGVLLQVALDVPSLERALELAGMVAPFADILEAGTPLIKAEGIGSVRALKEGHPDRLVCADLKTSDAGYMEVELAAEAGADIVTVLADAHDETVQHALHAAQDYDVEIMADLILSRLPVSRLADLLGISYKGTRVHYALVHSGLDRQLARMTPLADLASVSRLRDRPKLAVAGGLRVEDIPKVLAYPVKLVIVGGSIIRSRDPAKAAASFKKTLQTATQKEQEK